MFFFVNGRKNPPRLEESCGDGRKNLTPSEESWGDGRKNHTRSEESPRRTFAAGFCSFQLGRKNL